WVGASSAKTLPAAGKQRYPAENLHRPVREWSDGPLRPDWMTYTVTRRSDPRIAARVSVLQEDPQMLPGTALGRDTSNGKALQTQTTRIVGVPACCPRLPADKHSPPPDSAPRRAFLAQALFRGPGSGGRDR